MFERKKALKEIEEKLNTVQMYLENNYKDLTLQSYKDAKEVVERYEKSGLLKQKDPDMIQKKDISKIATWAEKEGNPLYPVPVVWKKSEFSRFVNQLYDESKENM